MLKFLRMAGEIALPNTLSDVRGFWLGCVGLRKDGVLVSARNGAVAFSTSVENYQLVPSSHAEGRVLRKLGKDGVLFVARVSKLDGGFKMARACGMCRVRIKSAHVKKVYYTIDNSHYGIWFPSDNSDKIYEL